MFDVDVVVVPCKTYFPLRVQFKVFPPPSPLAQIIKIFKVQVQIQIPNNNYNNFNFKITVTESVQVEFAVTSLGLLLGILLTLVVGVIIDIDIAPRFYLFLPQSQPPSFSYQLVH